MNTMLSSRWLLLITGAAGLACTTAEETVVAPSTAVEPAAVAAPVPPPATSPPRAPVAADVAEPTVPAGPPSAVPVAADAPRFDRVAVGNDDADGFVALLRTTNGDVFAAVGPVLARLGADGSYVQDPTWLRGLGDGAGNLEAVTIGYDWLVAAAMGGSWPEGAYFVLQPQSGGRGEDTPHETFRRTNGAWVRVDTRKQRFDWYPQSFGPWKDGSLLALRAFEPRYSRYDDEGDAPANEVRSAAAAIAREKRLIVLRGQPKAPAFGTQDVRAFASLPTGEIYAAVAKRDAITMLHHDDASGAQQTFELPGRGKVSVSPLEVVATGDDRVWVFGATLVDDTSRGYVAKFEGRVWEEVATPCVDAASSGSIDDAGNAYFVCDVERTPGNPEPALLRARRGAVEELPTGIVPGAVVATSPTDIWVVSRMFERDAALVHTGTKVTKPHALPTRVDAGRAAYEWAAPREIVGNCETAWIPLIAGADPTAAEKAVDGVELEEGYKEFYEARVQGRTEFGVSIHGVGGKHLASAAKKVRIALGSAAGTATCNQRPAVDPDR